MAARTTREAAREVIRAAFEKALDQMIPEDESIPLRGRTFREWEDQADAFAQAVTATVLEERVALEDSALRQPGEELGRCPHCGSGRLYLQRSEAANRPIRTTHGEAVLGHQSLRCRSCGKSFSPSGAGLGSAGGDAIVPQGASANGAGGDQSAVRQGGPGAE